MEQRLSSHLEATRPNFIVITGFRSFPLYALDPVHAIETLKAKIDARRMKRKDPEIGMSLVNALDEGRLNFIVMDFERTTLLCGELNAIGDRTHLGQFQQTVTRELAETLVLLIPERLMPPQPCKCGYC